MNNRIEFNYYQLKLLSYLLESHPDKASNIDFIKQRASKAAEAEEQALQEGYTQQQASEISNNILFEGLHFSKHDTIKNILATAFSKTVREENVKSLAILVQPDCETVLEKFQPVNERGEKESFPDDFIAETAMDDLEEELTQHIKMLLDNYGI